MTTPLSARESFDEFYRSRFSAVVRLGILLVDDHATAEELAQEAFVQTQQRYDSLTNPDGFVRRCVVNRGRDVQRRRATERRNLHDRSSFDVAASTVAKYREMDDILISLPYPERATVVCRYFLDLPEAEIAELLDVAPSTVRTLAARAIAALRKEIQP